MITLGSLVWRNRRLARELASARALIAGADGAVPRHSGVAPAAPAIADDWLSLPARSALDALWVWDIAADRIRFSARWRVLVGMAAVEVHQSIDEWWSRVHPSDRTQLRVDTAALFAGTQDRFSVEHRVRHEDGRWLNLQWVGEIERDAHGHAMRVAGSVRDITALRSAEERQRRDALYDALTGLPNRSLAIELLRRAINRTLRQGQRRFAVLLVDLDRFNLLNDSLGHAAGDEILRGVAQRLSTAVRPGDVIARLGADQFLLLLDDICEVEDAESVADRVTFVLAEPLVAIANPVSVSASIGIVLHDAELLLPTDYLRDAELAMHGAKRQGGARHERFSAGMRDGVRHRVSVEQDLRGAIDRDEFRVLYQPIWCMRGHMERLIGFEALLRWQHPQKGMLGAGEFVPIAEETDLIVALGAWTMHRACRELLEFPAEGVDAPWVSVNVAARQLADRSLTGVVDSILHATGLDPARLKLEVTENVILHDEAAASDVLETLRARGVRSVMDDFGTGHASLSYLHRLPIGTIKIDRYFIGRMDVSTECLEIVRSIVALARSLGMEVVAEGVEQEAQLAQLRDLGCQAVQGYLLARPLHAEEAIALVAALGHSVGVNPRVVLRDLGLAGGHRTGVETPIGSIAAT